MPFRLTLVALVVTLLAGCGGTATETTPTEPAAGAGAEGVFVGQVDDSDAYIALLSNGNEITTGYICDDNDISIWLDASPIEDGIATLVDRDGNELGEATLSAEQGADGEVDIEGDRLAFSATPASGDAGLYRETSGTEGEPGFEETGWIVLADGSVRGRRATVKRPGGTKLTEAPSQPGDSAEFIDPTSDF